MQSAKEVLDHAMSAAGLNPPTARLMCTIKQPGAVHVTQCGHKFDPREMPRNNCGFCWGVYFELHPAEVPAGQSVIKVYGKEAVIKSKGLKYCKALQKAIEAYQWKQDQERSASLTATQETVQDAPAEEAATKS